MFLLAEFTVKLQPKVNHCNYKQINKTIIFELLTPKTELTNFVITVIILKNLINFKTDHGQLTISDQIFFIILTRLTKFFSFF